MIKHGIDKFYEDNYSYYEMINQISNKTIKDIIN